MTKVKICGITNLEDAQHAVECGADMLGFNFYRGSKRFIEPDNAASIISGISRVHISIVGVFVNAETAEIAELAERIGLDAIQLHGDEGKEQVSEVYHRTQREMIKAIRPQEVSDLDVLFELDVHKFLIDGYDIDAYGGTGTRADLDIVRAMYEFLSRTFLAGGLTPENVAEAIRTVRPYAVDVATGVESSPGKKDPVKVAAFIKAAKEAI